MKKAALSPAEVKIEKEKKLVETVESNEQRFVKKSQTQGI